LALAAAPGRSFGVGLIGWSIQEADPVLAQVIDARPAMVAISFGDITEHVAPLHDAGIVVAAQAGNLDEALAADAIGVDIIVARGAEGGGHGRNEIATLPLLQQILDAVDTPVLAAGGIGTRRGLAAVLAAGAEGGWIGTGFMTCPEADTPAESRHAVLEADAGDTVYSRVFDLAQGVPWPAEFGGRSLVNEVTRRWAGREEELAAGGPAVLALGDQIRSARAAGDAAFAPVYAGQSAGLVETSRPAAEVLAELAGAAALLTRFHAGGGPGADFD
jgi:nitronate monooxygenase